MSITWREKRKNIIIILLLVLFLAFVFYKIYPYFNRPPTCFDGIKNGEERDVDCGGSCSKICATDVSPLEVKFSRSVNTENALYDLVGLVENRNKDKGVIGSKLDFIFKVYDKSGSLVKSFPGSSFIPVGQTFPIIFQNAYLDFSDSGNGISNVVLEIINDTSSWIPVNSVYSNPFLSVLETNFEQNKNNTTQLKINYTNLTRATFRDVPVRVVLYDEEGNVFSVNESILKEVKPVEKGELVFYWRKPLDIVDPRVEIFFIITPDTYIK